MASFVGHAQTSKLIAWGVNTYGQVKVPAAATNAVAFACGENHNLAVRPDGTVVAWGANTQGQSTVPPDATNVVAVAAGQVHSLALRADGTVVAWGGSDGLASVPDAATNVIAIAAAASHSLALRSDGVLLSWGVNTNANYAWVPETATNVIAISIGTDISYAFREDGAVLAWQSKSARMVTLPDLGEMPAAVAGSGSSKFILNAQGELRGWRSSARMNVRATNVAAIAALDGNLLALRADGTLQAWGGAGATNLPAGAAHINAISVGKTHGLARVGDGRPSILGSIRLAGMASAGNRLPLVAMAVGDGELTYQWLANGLPVAGASQRLPQIVAHLGDDAVEYQVVVSSALGTTASSWTTVKIRPLHVWGRTGTPQIAAPSTVTDPIRLAAGGSHSLALQPDGSVEAWGKNTDGQVSLPEAARQDVVGVAAGGAHSLAIKTDGTVLGWGRNWFGQASVPATATNVVAVSAGWGHSLALRADGTLVAWGANEYGQGLVSFLATEVKSIACGYFHNLALRHDGRVVGWGLEADAPPEATNVTAIAAGFAHSLALRQDGTVLAWGDDQYGQATVPAAATNIVAISAGFYHSLALRRDGTVLAWGNPVFNTTTYPRGLAHARLVVAGEDHSMAVVDTGQTRFGLAIDSVSTYRGGPLAIDLAVQAPAEATYQWLHEGAIVSGATQRSFTLAHAAASDAGNYQLSVTTGAGTVLGPAIQVRVTGETGAASAVGGWGNPRATHLYIPSTASNPEAIAAGAFHALAALPDGSVVAWGKSTSGQTNVPAAASNVVSVAAGGDHSLALRRDGSIIGWGRNWDGQAEAPVTSGVRAIAAGWAHSLALKADGSVLLWGNNDYGQLDIPPEATALTAIAAGYYHNLGLRTDGTVVAWGWENDVPTEATNVVFISAGWGHSLAVRSDGVVVAWGDNGAGQCDVPVSATNVIAVAAGFYHSLALRADGTVVAWGKDVLGGLQVPGGLRDVTAIAAGEDYNLALTRTGVPQFGSMLTALTVHQGGRAILRTSVLGTYPFLFQWMREGVALAGETNLNLVLPALEPGQAGLYTLRVSSAVGSVESQGIQVVAKPEPRVADAPQHVVQLPHDPVCLAGRVEGAPPFTFAWLRDGELLTEGVGVQGVNSPTLCLADPVPAQSGHYSLRVSNAAGSSVGLVAVLAVSPVIAWGDNTAGQLRVAPMKVAPIALAAGAQHTLALLADGTVSAWGDDSFGQCKVPKGLRNVVAVAAGEAHSVALLKDGSMVGWGDDTCGQSSSPPSVTNILAIAAGGSSTLVHLDDGTLRAWGVEIFTDYFRAAPRQLSSVKGIYVGQNTFMALRPDGLPYEWWAWVLYPPAQPMETASLGASHGLGVTPEGAVLAWGKNNLGQTTVPADLGKAVAVAAGGGGSLALISDGTLRAWGDVSFDQRVIPQAATNIIAVSRGQTHAVALRYFEELPVTAAPAHQGVFAGEGVALKLQPPLTSFHACQWYHQGQPIVGATNSVLNVEAVRWEDRGNYQLVATWPFGAVTSSIAAVAIRRHAFVVGEELITTNMLEAAAPVTVSIQSPFPGGSVSYTTDGTDPAVGGQNYAGPFTVSKSAVLRCSAQDSDGAERMETEPLTVLFTGEVMVVGGSEGGGTVAVEPGGSFFARGSAVTVTARPDPGWTFLHWDGDADGSAAVLQLHPPRSLRVRAVFGTALQVETVGDGAVRLTPSLPYYPWGSVVQATAVPGQNSYLSRWEGALESSRSMESVRVEVAGLNVRAVFGSLPQYYCTLNIQAEGAGSVMGPRANLFPVGLSVTFLPMPAPGQQFLGWSGDLGGTFTPGHVDLNQSKTVTAIFTRRASLRLLTPPERVAGEGLRFEVQGTPGESYEIQHSGQVDLWPATGVLTNWLGTVPFTDTNPAAPAGFYRVLIRP